MGLNVQHSMDKDEFYPRHVLFCLLYCFPSKTLLSSQIYTCALVLFVFVSYSHSKENQCDEFQPYVKKPPNAFMLFMKAQRPKVMAELKISGSVVVNTILGQRVSVSALYFFRHKIVSYSF